MDLSLFCLFPLILIVGLPSGGEAVMCFECNSFEIYNNPGCSDVLPTEVNSPFIKNCSSLPWRDDKYPFVRCRTMVQDVEGDVRVVRSCATHPDPSKPSRCVDRTGTSKIKVRYCECDGDFCNGATKIYSSLVLFLTALLAFAMCR